MTFFVFTSRTRVAVTYSSQDARPLCKYIYMNDAHTIHCRSHVLQTPRDLQVPFASWPGVEKAAEIKRNNERETGRDHHQPEWNEEINREATNLSGSIFRWVASLKFLYILSRIKGRAFLSRLNLFQLDRLSRFGLLYVVLRNLGNTRSYHPARILVSLIARCFSCRLFALRSSKQVQRTMCSLAKHIYARPVYAR